RKKEHINDLIRSYDRGRGAYYAKSLLNIRLIRSYLMGCLCTMRNGSLRSSLREISAGVEFLCRAAFNQGRRFKPMNGLTDKKPAQAKSSFLEFLFLMDTNVHLGPIPPKYVDQPADITQIPADQEFFVS